MKGFAVGAAFTDPGSQPVLHFLGSPERLLVDGELLIEVGDERRVAAAGYAAVLPREQVHTFMVVSPTARYLTLHTPAGFDAFVRNVSDAVQATGATPDRAALVALAAEHGIDIVGPGLTLDDY